MGCDIDHQDGQTMLVETIIEGGLMDLWNRAHPDERVMPGDKIFGVNGLFGDVMEIIGECTKMQLLELRIRRVRSVPPVRLGPRAVAESNSASRPPPGPPQGSTGVMRGTVYEVALRKTQGLRLGFDIDLSDSASLLIEAVCPDSVASAWNEAHPEKDIRPADRIIEVNGVRGDPSLLVQECQREIAVLSLKIWRKLPAHEQPAPLSRDAAAASAGREKGPQSAAPKAKAKSSHKAAGKEEVREPEPEPKFAPPDYCIGVDVEHAHSSGGIGVLSSTMAGALSLFSLCFAVDDAFMARMGVCGTMVAISVGSFLLALVDSPCSKGLRSCSGGLLPFLRRTTVKGLAFVFLGSCQGLLRWLHGEEDIMLVMSVVIGAVYAVVGVILFVVGMGKSMRLDKARVHLCQGTTGPAGASFVRKLYERYAQAAPKVGLNLQEFGGLVRDAAGVFFSSRELLLIFEVLAGNGEKEMRVEHLHDWVAGGMVLL